MANLDIIKKVYLFEGFTEAELGAVSQLIQESNVINGDSVFSEGREAASMYILKSGTIEIVKSSSGGDDQRIATLSNGSHFGEMAFLDRAPRTGSAIARENCCLLEISYSGLESLIRENREIAVKLYRNFAQTLCKRMRRTTEDLSSLKELKLRHL